MFKPLTFIRHPSGRTLMFLTDGQKGVLFIPFIGHVYFGTTDLSTVGDIYFSEKLFNITIAAWCFSLRYVAPGRKGTEWRLDIPGILFGEWVDVDRQIGPTETVRTVDGVWTVAICQRVHRRPRSLRSESVRSGYKILSWPSTMEVTETDRLLAFPLNKQSPIEVINTYLASKEACRDLVDGIVEKHRG